MNIVVLCSPGTEACVKRELISLGVEKPAAISGRFTFPGDTALLMRLCLWLRCADRVLIEVASFGAKNFDELYEGTRNVEFSKFLAEGTKVLLDGNCFDSRLMAIKASGGVIKKAIMDNLMDAYGSTEESGESVTVYFDIIRDHCRISIDTCGNGLHKRGYRIKTYTAPLKETLAAAIIDLSLFPIKHSLVDLFCGSGTIAIEAAMRAENIAPGLGRHFDFEKLKIFDKSLFDEERAAAKALQKNIPVRIFASDISPEAVELARENAKNAGVENFIEFKVMDEKDFSSSEPCGIIVSNPPYGDRLSTKTEVKKLYSEFSQMFRKLPDWSCFILTDCADFEKIMHAPATKKRKLYNARLQCTLYTFLGKKPTK